MVQRLRLGDRIYVHCSDRNLSTRIRIRHEALGLMAGTGPASSSVTDPVVHSALLVCSRDKIYLLNLQYP